MTSPAAGADRGACVPVIGYGPLGRAIVPLLLAAGHEARVIQRHAPPGPLPEGASFAAADVMDTDSLVAAIGAAGTVILAIGLPYDSRVWERDWPRAMDSVLRACERLGARLVFADNLYLYGPRDRPLTEDMAPSDYGRKPKVRAAITGQWQRADAEGRVRTAAVRAPDFYGPGVAGSVIGDPTLGNLARGKAAQVFGDPNHPHDVAHIRDFARAVVTLAEAPDDAYGQAWHVPVAPTRTMRELLGIGAEALGVPLRITVLPGWLLALLAPFVPLLRELRDMHFLFDRPYRVDASKFARRFWSDATPLEEGIAEAARSFRR